MTDWDAAFNNRDYIDGGAEYPPRWAAAAADYRAAAQVECDIAYGAHPRARMDIVWPEAAPKGLAVFVHGGYWMQLSKADWTHLAEGARARGWAVAIPSYPLAPEVPIGAITEAVARAIEGAAARVPGPIRLAGHSAGGHLVTRMLCEDGPLAEGVAERVDHVLSISGVHDLRPLLWTGMNQTLRLDMAQASAESPVLCRPREGAALTCWVGGGERPEFVRQSRLMAMIWQGVGAETSLMLDAAHHHFSVLDGLGDPGSAMCEAFVGGA